MDVGGIMLLLVLPIPELFQFVGDSVPVIYGECAFAHHHYGHLYFIKSAIDIRVPEAVSEIELVPTLALLDVGTFLTG